MFVRARPTIDKYYILDLFRLKIKPQAHYCDNFLFFNSGRGALKWFLQNISEVPLKVGLQAYTCSSVLDAINEANHKVVFLDTNENYFTTLLPDLMGHEDLDVLILTHLFGIPNPDYLEIKKWANKYNIIIIDDLAQTVKSKINGEILENLSEYYFYSFSFDKPLSAGGGALLKIDNLDIFKLKEKYKKLKREKEKTGKINLKKLVFYFELTSNKLYKKEFRLNSGIEKLLFNILPINWRYFSILSIILSSRFNFFMNKFGSKNVKEEKIISLQLSNIMKLYINHILKGVDIPKNETLFLAKNKLLEIDKNMTFLYDKNITISYGLRLAALSSKPKYVIEQLATKGIECGNHNWPNLITKKTEYYPNSKNIVDKILNIPIWSKEIWEDFHE